MTPDAVACRVGRTVRSDSCISCFYKCLERRVWLIQVQLWEMAARLVETVALPIKVAHQRLMELLLA